MPPPPVPAGNPITTAKANLGKVLFWDEQMSSTGTVACATCHHPRAGGSDPRSMTARHPGFDGLFHTDDDVRGSPGVIAHGPTGSYLRAAPYPLLPQVTGRKAPSVLMAAYSQFQFWDGRADGVLRDPHTGQVVLASGASLEHQVLEPPLSAVEMTHAGTSWRDIEQRIAASEPLALATNVPAALAAWIGNRSYPDLFREAFGTPDVTAVRIAMAIATYERTLVPDQAPIDRWLRGDDGALTAEQLHGKFVFEQIGLCTFCHRAPTFARATFSDIGVRPLGEDRGRWAVTGQARDDNAFKAPSLRNVAERAPYFHNGSQRTLAEVVDFYARGGDFQNPFHAIQPFNMTAYDRQALIAFLAEALTDPRVSRGQPPFDHPTLFAGSAREPGPYGYASSQGGEPALRLIGPEPPLLGRRLRLAVADGPPNAPAILLLDAAQGAHDVAGVRILVGLTPALAVIDLGRLANDAGGGWTSFTLDLPPDPVLADATVFVQAIAAGPTGLAASPGLRLRLFAAR
ncbi:MAG TPA: cytochrome c peroxidase [Planctomycetota bacterium]|nr:cytochrome c peroxidase [Planctomycetota bacterium]